MLTSIVSAAIVLGLLIIVHEAGHFLMAKRLGVRVLRFSIGYPPKIWGTRLGETEYVIGGTPLGGYVRMLGEEVGEEPHGDELENYVRELSLDVLGAARTRGWKHSHSAGPDAELIALARCLDSEARELDMLARNLRPEEAAVIEEIRAAGSVADAAKAIAKRTGGPVSQSFRQRAFPTQSLARRASIVLAGPLANLLFAPILMTAAYMYGVPSVLPIIGQVKAGMPASAAGLLTGDRILSVDGQPVGSWSEFSEAVKSSNGKPLRIELARGTAGAAGQATIVVSPRREEEPTGFGGTASAWVIGVLPRGDEALLRYGPIGAAKRGVGDTIAMTAMLGSGIMRIIDGSTPVRQALGGPIMIAQMAGREARQGLASLLVFMVMLSLELGFINLLPVPMLDGGHLLFFICEGLRGKPLKLRHREIALQVGLFLLVVLMAFVIFNDISHIAQG